MSGGGDGIFGESTNCLLGFFGAKGEAKGSSPGELLVKISAFDLETSRSLICCLMD